MGDALQTAAFEIMAHPDTHEEAEVRAELTYRLARASGARGMAGGQMIDILRDGHDVGQAVRMQRMKTGALISFAFEIPVVIAQPDEARRTAMRGFAQDLGLAYQIVDDRVGSHGARGVGKGRGADVTRLHAGASRERAELLSAQCKAHLDIFGEDAKYLRECVDFVLDRRA